MAQEVDIDMSTNKTFMRKVAGPQSLEVNVVMEPEPHLQPAGTSVEGGGFASR